MAELLTVLTILGLLGAIAAPRYASSVARYRAVSAAQRIAADLCYAQSLARNSSVSQTISFDVASLTYQISGVASLDNRSSNYGVSLAAAPYVASTLAVSFNGQTQVTFDPYGMPDNGGTVTVQSGSFRKTVQVDAASGRATVQ